LARRGGPLREIEWGSGCGLGGRVYGSHRLGRAHSAVYMGLTWITDDRFLPPQDEGYAFRLIFSLA
jgi:hypothetical protein